MAVLTPENNTSIIDQIALAGHDKISDFVEGLSRHEIKALLSSWEYQRRPSQNAFLERDWRYRVWLGGRGSGKTLAGAHAVREAVFNHGVQRLAFIARRSADIRTVMVDGATGILNIGPEEQRPIWKGPPTNRVIWPQTGAIADCFSAEEAKQGAGPNSEFSWCDEMALWPFDVKQEGAAVNMWNQVKIFTRAGKNPRIIVTTTPRPVPAVRSLVSDPRALVSRDSSYANRSNLPKDYFDTLKADFGDTRLGRQEIYAEILDEVPGAHWQSEWIDSTRVPRERKDELKEQMDRIVVAVDPAFEVNEESHYTGIAVCGVKDGEGYVFESMRVKVSSRQWADIVATLYQRYMADCVVAEVNHGGEIVEENLRVSGGIAMPIKTVRAKKGKILRSEPVSHLYELRKVHHIGMFAKLESEMIVFPEAHEYDDDIDALVYALSELMVKDQPIVRFWAWDFS